MSVAIVDSGGANIASLRFALERLGATALVSRDPDALRRAPRVILPGVGAAGDAMRRLSESGLAGVIPALRQPVLGICLGMQLLFEASEEGPAQGLGVLPGRVRRLLPAPGTPVPHMGWSRLRVLRGDPLLQGIASQDYFYFVHGYAADPDARTLATVEHGAALAAVVRRDNFWGTQFHPERSGPAGARVLRNFIDLPGTG